MIFAIAVCVLVPYTSSGISQTVIINEVEYNPRGPVAHNQWIELYNKDQKLFDISGWLVKSTTLGKTYKIPDGFVIMPNGYLVIPFNSVMFALEYESVVLLTRDSVEVDRIPELSDIGDDEQTWQRFPNGIDTDTALDWSFRSSAPSRSNGFHEVKQNFTLSAPAFVDQEDNEVQSVTAGQMTGVKSEIVNEYADERTFAYIVQIKNEEGITVFMSWIEDLTLTPNRTVRPTVFWLAEERGTFIVESFVWRSLNIPQPLTFGQSGLLRVAG